MFKEKVETLIKFRLDDTGMFWKDIMGSLKTSYEVSQKIPTIKDPTTLEKS